MVTFNPEGTFTPSAFGTSPSSVIVPDLLSLAATASMADCMEAYSTPSNVTVALSFSMISLLSAKITSEEFSAEDAELSSFMLSVSEFSSSADSVAELSVPEVSGSALSGADTSDVSGATEGSTEGSALLSVEELAASKSGALVSSAKTVVPNENSRSTDKSTASVFEAFFIFSTSIPFFNLSIVSHTE